MKTLLDFQKLITKPSHVIKYSDSIETAIKTMLDRNLSTCPVIDASGAFVGQISDAVLIKGIIMIRSNIDLKLVYDLRRFFLKPPTVLKTATLQEIIKKIFVSQSQRVFVLDSKQRLIGVVSPKEVLESISQDILNMNRGKVKNQKSKRSLQMIKFLKKSI